MSAKCLLILFTIIGCYRTDSGEGVGVRMIVWACTYTLTLKIVWEFRKKFPVQMNINYLDPHRKAITFEEKTKQN